MGRKVVVAVKAEFDVFGQLTPISFCWENGEQYAISRVVDRRRAVSLRSGGCGMRYTCKVDGKLIYLFYDDTVWYLESG
ncbi:MAG: hypothetical protein ACYC5K_06940 [Saccharofermentanales bacterium]